MLNKHLMTSKTGFCFLVVSWLVLSCASLLENFGIEKNPASTPAHTYNYFHRSRKQTDIFNWKITGIDNVDFFLTLLV